MKITAAIIIQFCLISICIGQEWKEFRSNYGDFSVMTPGPMSLKTFKTETELGEIEVLNFSYVDEEGISDNHLYMLTTYLLPEGTIESGGNEITDSLFQANIDRSIYDLSGKLLYAHDEMEQGRRTMTWKVIYDRGVAKFKCFYMDDRYFLLQVYSEKDNSINTSINRYLQSFRYLGSD